MKNLHLSLTLRQKPPIMIQNDTQHETALAQLEKWLFEDKTYNAQEVEQLARQIEAYEEKRWPIQLKETDD